MTECKRTGDQERGGEAGSAVAPEQEGEALLLGVEGDVGVGALGVVVGGGHLGAGGVEASTPSDLGGRADSGAGEHLRPEDQFSINCASIAFKSAGKD